MCRKSQRIVSFSHFSDIFPQSPRPKVGDQQQWLSNHRYRKCLWANCSHILEAVLTSMFSDGVLSIFPLPWRAQRAKWAKTAAVRQNSGRAARGPTFSLLFTIFSSRWTSSSFLCFSLSAEASATHQQHAASRHSTSGFIFSGEERASRSKVLFRRFGGNAKCRGSYLFIRIPEETGKPLAESWKAAETSVTNELSFPLATTWSDRVVKLRVRGVPETLVWT